MIGNLADVAHSEQIRFEPERKDAGFDVVAGAGNDQVRLAEPVDHGLDSARLFDVAADGALQRGIGAGQCEQ